MPKKTTIDFDDLLLEGDVHELIADMSRTMKRIHDAIPNESPPTPNGEPNARTRWGAVYFHAMMARSSLRAFL